MNVICTGCRFLFYVIIDSWHGGELRGWRCKDCREEIE